MHVLVAGAGWLGSAVGSALLARGDRVTAVRRRAEGLEALRLAGFEAVRCDLAEPQSLEALPRDLDAIVACQSAAPPGRAGGSPASEPGAAYRTAYVEVNRHLLGFARGIGAKAFVYTGSTGLFGQRDGSTVDEATPPVPADLNGQLLLEAEQLVRAAGSPQLRSCVLRLSGLYGPGRFGIVERVRSGALALGPGDDCVMNFCHREDAVAAVLAALDRGRAGAVYHASDAHPTARREVVRWIAQRLGLAAPQASDDVRSFAGANRRIDATSSRRELGLTLAYPSFREGLAPFFG